MSGVYIKGIEMPANVEGCEVIIRIQPNGEVLDLHGFHIGATAIPVPDHGRLIDADALDTRDRGNNSSRTMWQNIRWLLKDAPTIIPADKED